MSYWGEIMTVKNVRNGMSLWTEMQGKEATSGKGRKTNY